MPHNEVLKLWRGFFGLGARHRNWRVMISREVYMYAIIATGGKQYKVAEGDIIKVERLGLDAGASVTFDQVLAVNDGEMAIGAPTLEGASVLATVVKEAKAKKVIVYKYKRKTGYHKKNGHRQTYTEVKIDKINA